MEIQEKVPYEMTGEFLDLVTHFRDCLDTGAEDRYFKPVASRLLRRNNEERGKRYARH